MSEAVATRVPVLDLTKYFLRLGVLGFGGPVALVGQMERELVDERDWLPKEQMREAIAICQSLARAARDSSWYLCLLSSRRILGRLDRRLGLHPSKFFNRRRVGRALCPSRRSQTVTGFFTVSVRPSSR